MKIGSHPDDDLRRVRVAKEAIGEASLFVDANGAYSVKQALRMANAFAAEAPVAWFEEPVSSDDLDGLAQVRTGAPDCMDIAAGEYAYNVDDMRHMLVRRAVDVQQADASRCLGITGFLQAGGALRRASHRPFRSLCACAACSPCLRGAALAPSGMVSRPRTHRAHAVRGRAGREEWRDRAGHEPSGPGSRVQGARCGALRCMTTGIEREWSIRVADNNGRRMKSSWRSCFWAPPPWREARR